VPTTSANPYRPLIILASVILVVAALYWAQKILIPIALAVLLAFILSPLIVALQRRRVGRITSVLLVVTLAFAILAGAGLIITREMNGLVAELPKHEQNIKNKIAQLRETGKGTIFENVQRIIQDLTQEFARGNDGAKDDEPPPTVVRIESSGLSRLQAAAGPVAELAADTALVVILVIFLLVQREDMRNRLVRLVAHGSLISTTRALDEASRRISRYLLSQVLINAGFGLLLSMCLFAIGVPYAFLWGFLAGLLRFIPYVGTWAAAALLMVFSFVIFPQWSRPILVLGSFLALELVTANAIEPLVFGHNTGISSLALLVAAAFWTWLWGPIGLILSTPISVCLVVLGKYVSGLEFFDVLLGDQPALDTPIRYYQRLLARDQDEAADLVEEYVQNHPVESIYDAVLVPALVLAKRDKERGELDNDDEQFILTVTRELLEDLDSTQRGHQDTGARQVEGAAAERPKAWVIGCPVLDAEDELALHMFRLLLEPAGYEVEVFPSAVLTAELIARIGQENAPLVCLAALPPGGLTKVRYLCKQLHREIPSLKILVGRWGSAETAGQTADRLKAAGAQLVATTLVESRNQVIPLLQSLSHTQEVVAQAPVA
jgi:predicted PurR-regulated permease PerM